MEARAILDSGIAQIALGSRVSGLFLGLFSGDREKNKEGRAALASYATTPRVILEIPESRPRFRTTLVVARALKQPFCELEQAAKRPAFLKGSKLS